MSENTIDPSRLEEKWVALENILISRRLFIKNESVHTTDTTYKVDGASISPAHAAYQLPNCNEDHSHGVPESRVRRAVRGKSLPGVQV